MTAFIQRVSLLFALFIIIGDFLLLLILILAIAKIGDKFLSFLAKHSLALACSILLAGSAGSLFYSHIAGFNPCDLCWIQRGFIFLAIGILSLRLKRDSRSLFLVNIATVTGGVLTAAYHSYIQYGGNPLIPCSVAGTSSCATRFIFEFGFVTIPFMSFSAFLFVFTLLLLKTNH